MARTKKTTTQVTSIRHKDKRANIPTEELRDFVADEELAPKTILYLYTIKCISLPRSIPQISIPTSRQKSPPVL